MNLWLSFAHAFLKNRWRYAEIILEQATEVLRVSKAHGIGRFGNAIAGGEHGFGALQDEPADGAGGRVTGQLLDEVAKIVGRQKQFLSAILHCG